MRQDTYSNETKQKIYDMSVKLFYEKGYAATKITEICDKLGLTKGAFYHHYLNKLELGSQITLNFSLNNEKIIHLFGDGIDNVIGTCLETKAYWYIFFKDENIRRFLTDISKENNIIETKDDIFIPNLCRQLNKVFSEDELTYISIAHIGLIRHTIYTLTQTNQYNYDEISDYYLKTLFKFLEMDMPSIENILLKTKDLFSQCSIVNDYFDVTCQFK